MLAPGARSRGARIHPRSYQGSPALAASECGLWLGARAPGAQRHHWEEHLSLAELGRLARLVQARLLALDDPSVSRQEAGALERDAQLGIRLDERTGDSVSNGACLSARTA